MIIITDAVFILIIIFTFIAFCLIIDTNFISSSSSSQWNMSVALFLSSKRFFFFAVPTRTLQVQTIGNVRHRNSIMSDIFFSSSSSSTDFITTAIKWNISAALFHSKKKRGGRGCWGSKRFAICAQLSVLCNIHYRNTKSKNKNKTTKNKKENRKKTCTFSPGNPKLTWHMLSPPEVPTALWHFPWGRRKDGDPPTWEDGRRRRCPPTLRTSRCWSGRLLPCT